MQTMVKEFNLPIGYTDHTAGIKVSLAARALGACVIEKHFTLDRNLPGPDHKASLEPQELKAMVEGIRNVEKRLKAGETPEKIIKELDIAEVLGDGIKKPNPSEIEIAKIARKSIVAAQNIKKGTKITENMLAVKRPGTGIESKYLDKFLGKIARQDIKKDELLTWEAI